MAFHFKQNCKVCNTILQESPDNYKLSALYKLINEAQLGRRPMADAARAYPDLLYVSITNHGKKHQNVTPSRLAKARVRAVEKKVQQEVAKKTVHHTEARADALSKLRQMMEEGELKGATFTAMAALLKQEADIEEKQKDRTHEMQKLFAGYLANPLPEKAVKHIEYVEAEVIESDTPPSTQ